MEYVPCNVMISIKVDEAGIRALDWLVAAIEGLGVDIVFFDKDGNSGYAVVKRETLHSSIPEPYRPSIFWHQGGPLIDKYDIEFVRFGDADRFADDPDYGQKPCICALINDQHRDSYVEYDIEQGMLGDTRLIAACRVIVKAHLGDTVQVPAILVEGGAA